MENIKDYKLRIAWKTLWITNWELHGKHYGLRTENCMENIMDYELRTAWKTLWITNWEWYGKHYGLWKTFRVMENIMDYELRTAWKTLRVTLWEWHGKQYGLRTNKGMENNKGHKRRLAPIGATTTCLTSAVFPGSTARPAEADRGTSDTPPSAADLGSTHPCSDCTCLEEINRIGMAGC